VTRILTRRSKQLISLLLPPFYDSNLCTALRAVNTCEPRNKVSAEKMSAVKARLSHDEVTRRRKAAEAKGSDCQVGPFEPWSDCEGPCGGSGFQHRLREVLAPKTGGGRKCPALEEVRTEQWPWTALVGGRGGAWVGGGDT